MAIVRDRFGKFTSKGSKVKVKGATKAPQVTYVAFVIDESGSMGHLREDVPKQFMAQIKELVATKQKVFVSVFTLDNIVKKEISKVPVADITGLDYNPGGSTPLFDAVKAAVEEFDFSKGLLTFRKSDNVGFLINVLTDGEENSSKKFGSTLHEKATKFKELIANINADPRMTITFQLPIGKRATFASTFNVDIENCVEWEPTKQGYNTVQAVNRVAIGNYMSSRTLGVTKSANFYKATTDLGALRKSTVTNALDEWTDRFKIVSVQKESEIAPFVETVTGKPYMKGSAFYQLTKPETIQANKEVALIKKSEPKRIWSGDEARTLIGLKAWQDGKVTPGNHGDWDIFVQSTSSNRKLVRGTKLLVTK